MDQIGLNDQRHALGKCLARQMQIGNAEVLRLFDPHVDQVQTHARLLGQLFAERLGGLRRPVGFGQVGEHVDFFALLAGIVQQPQRVAKHACQRRTGRATLEPLDAVLGGQQVEGPRFRSVARVEHGHFAVARQLRQQPQARVACRFEPRFVLVAIFHPRAGIENQRGGHGRFLVPQPAGALQARTRERGGQQHDERHPQGQQHQMPQFELAAVGALALLDEPQRRKLQVPRLAAHHQMQRQRHAHRERSPQEGAIQKRQLPHRTGSAETCPKWVAGCHCWLVQQCFQSNDSTLTIASGGAISPVQFHCWASQQWHPNPLKYHRIPQYLPRRLAR